MLWSLDPVGGPGKQDAGHGDSLAKRNSGEFLNLAIRNKFACRRVLVPVFLGTRKLGLLRSWEGKA